VKPTRASTLISVAVVAAVAGFALDTALTARQSPTLLMSVPLGLTLVFIGIALLFMAAPIRRQTRGRAERRVDPMYATRVVFLAKASSICGALFGAFALGLLAYLLTRSVLPSLGSTLPNAVAFGGAMHIRSATSAHTVSTIPPPDEDDHDGRGTTAA
jgi:uncharacterized membrane protein YidH (DUF202 family)